MKFPYKLYRMNKGPGVPNGLMWRPRIPVIVIGPMGEVRLEALVDTGSDQTILPQVNTSEIGLKIDHQRQALVYGRLREHEELLNLGRNVRLGLQLDSKTYVWPATVWFSDSSDSPAILGRIGFLEYFDVTFYGKKLELEIKPTSDFPGVVSGLWE